MIKKASIHEKNLVENLLQLYLHDASIYFPIKINSLSGRYVYDNFDSYFDNDNRFAYLFYDNNEIIGFALIDKDGIDMNVQEMFILNQYKGRGYGEKMITQLFDMFKGNWTIKALPNSPKAENFWNKVVNKYTNGNYNLEHTGKYQRAEFRFNNEKR